MKRRTFLRDTSLAFGAISFIPKGLNAWTKQGNLYLPTPPPPANVPSYSVWLAALGNPAMGQQTPTVTNNTNNITIQNKIFDDATAKQIDFDNCDNLLIKDSYFTSASGRCIELSNCDGIEISHCFFENIGMAMYFLSCTNINIHHCVALNLLGPPPPSGFGQMTQFDQCNAPDSKVEDCYVVCLPGASDSEDKFNFYKSNGTSGHPILCRRNYVWGWGPSSSGTGILVSDGDTSSACTFIEARNNVIIYSGQVGIGCASGRNCVIDSNIVYGDQQAWSNVGIYVYDPYPVSGGCSNNTVSNNRVRWLTSGGGSNPSYLPSGSPPGCSGTVNSGNTFNDGTLNDAFPPPAASLWWTISSAPSSDKLIRKSRIRVI